MPLPQNNVQWPPTELGMILPDLDIYDAWYVGDPRGLEVAYGAATAYGENAASKIAHPNQLAGGVVGKVARFFWGAPSLEASSPKHKLHVPVAADLCTASADLLFAEAPTLSVDDKTAQARLDELVDDGVVDALAEAAEVSAALGGVFLRVSWDDTINPDGPFLTTVHADAAVPEFRWGRLTAVTFWHTLASKPGETMRHLERHELNAAGIGIILHGLYKGSADRLGLAVPLADHPATEALARQVDQDGAISTQSPGLAVVYVKNRGPQRRWRKDPLGRNLGRSDLDGVEGLMDSLDETYTSWMRDIRLGKARVFAPQELLKDMGPGKGAGFDLDQELFTPVGSAVGSLNMSGTSGTSQGFLLAQQFKIRFAEHESTAKNLKEQILRTAGYSSQTFGEGDFGNDVTATEVTVKQQRSFTTRDRKIRVWRPALGTIMLKLLAVDAAIFRSRVTPVRPDVQFADGVQDSMLALAQTAQALRGASAASTEVLVRLVHPDWDDEDVTKEVGRIAAEEAAANPPLMDPAGGFAPDEPQDTSGVDATG